MSRLRLSILLPLLVFLSSLLSSGLLCIQEIRSANLVIRHDGIQNLHTTLTHLQNVLNTQLAADNLEDARLSVAVTALHPGIRTLLLTDEHDRVLLANHYIWEGSAANKVAEYGAAEAKRVRQTQASSVSPDGGLLRGYYPVTLTILANGLGAEKVGVVFVEYDLAPQLAAARHNAVVQATSFGGIMIAAAVALALLLHFLVSRRVRLLVDASKLFAAGDLDARVAPGGRDELAELGAAFNHMADQRKQAEAELITHREHLELLVAERTRALRDSEVRYRTVANFTNDWEVWRGHDGSYLYVSPSCERITGYGAAEFVTDPELVLRILVPEDQPKFRQHLQLYGVGQGNEQIEFRLVRRDGEVIWVEHICQPVFDEQGNYLGTRASNRDVTERKRQALELARAKEAAESANRAKSVFLANMSHELRTPMNAILGFAQLMQQDASLSPGHRAKVETIARSGHHLLTLINDVLEISKIEAGRISLEPRPTDLIELLESIEEMNRLRAEKKGLALALKVTPEVPRYVRSDDKKLRQVLVNLLGNAIKFTEHGGITVQASRQDDGRLLFEVSDTGCGIPPEEQQRIFEAFYQTPDASRRGEGTGLGLTISREYVQLMGGVLTVESTVGQGSTFRFSIALPPVPADEIDDHRSVRHVVGLAPGQAAYRILVAEDRPESRDLLRQILESAGFEVRTAENGERALNLFHTWHPHFIWMDMRMPVMDGYEATRKIKASPEGYATVVVALTASAFEEDRAEVLATGCDGFLRKPLNVDEIFAALAEHLGVRYLYADEATTPSAKLTLNAPALAAAVDTETRADLARAALLLDVTGAREVISRIAGQAPAVAEALGRMVDDFRFEELSKLCEERNEASPTREPARSSRTPAIPKDRPAKNHGA